MPLRLLLQSARGRGQDGRKTSIGEEEVAGLSRFFAPPLAAFLFCVAPSADAAEKVAEKVPEKVKVTFASFDALYLPYFIAVDRFYFAEQGLDVELFQAGGGTATPALMSGSVQFSSSAGSAESAILKGAPLKVVMTLAQTMPWKVWATRPEVASLADLKGKPIGVQTRGGLDELAMRAALMKAGLPQDWVIFSPIGLGSVQRLAVMQTQSLPVVFLSYLDEKMARQQGSLAHGHVLLGFEDIQIPYNGLAASDALLQRDPAMVKRFMRGVLMGVRYMKSFRDGSLRVLRKFNKEAPADVLSKSYDDAKPIVMDGGSVPEATQRTELALRALTMTVPEAALPPPEKVFDYSLVEQVIAELAASGWTPTE
jgi:NitT/TauT family transport system substrate-binding protein